MNSKIGPVGALNLSDVKKLKKKNKENRGVSRDSVCCRSILTTDSKLVRKSLADVTHSYDAYSRKFVITMRLGSLIIDREAVVAFSPPCDEFCITLEKGSGINCCNHIHCYFKFIDRFNYCKLISFYTDLFSSLDLNITVHVESVRSLRTYLRYITKEDVNPYFANVNANYFSFNYHCHKNLKSMDKWDPSHWFVVQHRNCYKYLEQLYYSIHSNYVNTYSYIWPWVGLDVDWFYKFESWYVNFVSTKFYHKKKHCYLWGISNAGKSTACRLLLSCLFNRVYYASDVYPFGGYYSNVHRAIVFEEFDYRKYDLSVINKCLEGIEFYCNQKYIVERIETCQVPVIFISNDEPPNIDSFLNRVEVIRCFCSVQFSDPIIEEVTSVVIEEGFGISDDSSSQ